MKHKFLLCMLLFSALTFAVFSGCQNETTQKEIIIGVSGADITQVEVTCSAVSETTVRDGKIVITFGAATEKAVVSVSAPGYKTVVFVATGFVDNKFYTDVSLVPGSLVYVELTVTNAVPELTSVKFSETEFSRDGNRFYSYINESSLIDSQTLSVSCDGYETREIRLSDEDLADGYCVLYSVLVPNGFAALEVSAQWYESDNFTAKILETGAEAKRIIKNQTESLITAYFIVPKNSSVELECRSDSVFNAALINTDENSYPEPYFLGDSYYFYGIKSYVKLYIDDALEYFFFYGGERKRTMKYIDTTGTYILVPTDSYLFGAGKKDNAADYGRIYIRHYPEKISKGMHNTAVLLSAFEGERIFSPELVLKNYFSGETVEGYIVSNDYEISDLSGMCVFSNHKWPDVLLSETSLDFSGRSTLNSRLELFCVPRLEPDFVLRDVDGAEIPAKDIAVLGNGYLTSSVQSYLAGYTHAGSKTEQVLFIRPIERVFVGWASAVQDVLFWSDRILDGVYEFEPVHSKKLKLKIMPVESVLGNEIVLFNSSEIFDIAELMPVVSGGLAKAEAAGTELFLEFMPGATLDLFLRIMRFSGGTVIVLEFEARGIVLTPDLAYGGRLRIVFDQL